MENTIVCPVHGEKFTLKSQMMSVLGANYNLLLGYCEKCRMIYTDQTIRGIGRFTYEGNLYQYLPELEQWRVGEQRKQEAERIKLKEEKRRQKIEKMRQEELLKKEEKLMGKMPKTIYVLQNVNVKVCPVCNKKIALNPMALTLENGKNGFKNVTVIGYSCTKCKSVFISEKLAEKDFLEQYTDRLNLDYLVTKVQRNEKSEKEEKYKTKYPLLEHREVKIHFGQYIQKRCPVHKNSIRRMGWILTQAKRKPELLLYGFYCKECNTIYMSEEEKKRVQDFICKYGEMNEEFAIVPAELRKQSTKAVRASFVDAVDLTLKSSKVATNQRTISGTDFKLAAYQKYEREIAEISAAVDGKERWVRVLTSVKEEDKRKCVPEDMLVREAETLGREFLGRIAHDQLDSFYAKGHEIKIYQYKVWSGQEHHLDGFTRFIGTDKMQDITIMSQKNIDRDSDEYEMVTALIYCANQQEPVYIDVYYSKRQNRYFINDESYRHYSSLYGLPYLRLASGEYDGDMDYGNLRQYSELNLYGYTVAKSAEMTAGARQKLLQQLMDNGLMSKHQIVNHLEWLIHRQSGRIRMEDACDCWREDLSFVNGYKIDKQRKIYGKFVYGKSALR